MFLSFGQQIYDFLNKVQVNLVLRHNVICQLWIGTLVGLHLCVKNTTGDSSNFCALFYFLMKFLFLVTVNIN